MKSLAIILLFCGCYYNPRLECRVIDKPSFRQLKADESYMNWKNATTYTDRLVWGLQYLRDQRRANDRDP